MAHAHGGVWEPGDILIQGARPKQSEAVVVHAHIGCGIHKGRAAPVSCPVGGEHLRYSATLRGRPHRHGVDSKQGNRRKIDILSTFDHNCGQTNNCVLSC